MPTFFTHPITQSCAEFDDVALLFDEYRQFYGLPSEISTNLQD